VLDLPPNQSTRTLHVAPRILLDLESPPDDQTVIGRSQARTGLPRTRRRSVAYVIGPLLFKRANASKTTAPEVPSTFPSRQAAEWRPVPGVTPESPPLRGVVVITSAFIPQLDPCTLTSGWIAGSSLLQVRLDYASTHRLRDAAPEKASAFSMNIQA
jgi:hypothetical protein